MEPGTKQILQIIEKNTRTLKKAIRQRYSSEVHAAATTNIASQTIKYSPSLQRKIKSQMIKESAKFKEDDKLVALLIEHYVISARNN